MSSLDRLDEIGIIPLCIKESFKILYGCSKIILLCSEDDSINSSTLTGNAIIMTSNCIYDIIVCFFLPHC